MPNSQEFKNADMNMCAHCRPNGILQLRRCSTMTANRNSVPKENPTRRKVHGLISVKATRIAGQLMPQARLNTSSSSRAVRALSCSAGWTAGTLSGHELQSDDAGDDQAYAG